MDIQAYIDQGEGAFKQQYILLFNAIKSSIPKGFQLIMQYNMPSFVVPLSLYPKGYRGDPTVPLPFISLGYQKHHIGLYHMGIYAQPEILSWFETSYQQSVSTKLNMGKSCIRFTKTTEIPIQLIQELVAKITPQTWIEIYENS
ncbi:DUF1801 domain-containing protein [Erysipelothrix rhusiopathiae]|nr:DUF1801 domain-containing protein [Erysipelothrix rhusiopathiae]